MVVCGSQRSGANIQPFTAYRDSLSLPSINVIRTSSRHTCGRQRVNGGQQYVCLCLPFCLDGRLTGGSM